MCISKRKYYLINDENLPIYVIPMKQMQTDPLIFSNSNSIMPFNLQN